MSMYLGRHRWSSSFALPQLGIELLSSLEVKRYKSARQSKAEELRVSRLLNSIPRQSSSWQQLVIASNLLSMRFSQVLQQLTESSSSTRSKQLRFNFGPVQRDQRGPVQPVLSETSGDEGRPTGASTRR